jgi:hypothetical protein
MWQLKMVIAAHIQEKTVKKKHLDETLPLPTTHIESGDYWAMARN